MGSLLSVLSRAETATALLVMAAEVHSMIVYKSRGITERCVLSLSRMSSICFSPSLRIFRYGQFQLLPQNILHSLMRSGTSDGV